VFVATVFWRQILGPKFENDMSTKITLQGKVAGTVFASAILVASAALILVLPMRAAAQSDAGAGTSALVEDTSGTVQPDNLPAVTGAVVDLSFNGGNATDAPGYLYFKHNDDDHVHAEMDWSADSVSTFSPRAVTSADANTLENRSFDSMGSAWLRDSFTPRQADAHLNYSYVKTDELSGEEKSRFDVALSSRLRVDTMDLPGLVNNPTLSSAANRRTYGLGVNVGYSGFNLGATMRGGSSAFANITSGYDVGLSYSGNSWSTSVLVGGYSREYKNVFSDVIGGTTNFYAMEFGASYKLNKAFSVSGSFRYLTFDDTARLSLFDQSRSGVFYLGTSLNF